MINELPINSLQKTGLSSCKHFLQQKRIEKKTMTLAKINKNMRLTSTNVEFYYHFSRVCTCLIKRTKSRLPPLSIDLPDNK